MGLIDERQFTAALEIRDIFDALSTLHFRAMGSTAVSSGKLQFHPLDGLSPNQKRLFDRNYRPWRFWADNRRYQGMTMTEITIAVVADSNPPPDQLMAPLIESLEKYADVQEGG